MVNRNEITEHGFAKVNNILKQFGDDSIEKSISVNEFNEKFGADHEIFSKGDLNKFISETTKNFEEGKVPEEVVKGLADELKTLSKVLVKSEAGITEKYVRPVIEKKEEVETTEEETVEKGETTEETSEEELEKGEKLTYKGKDGKMYKDEEDYKAKTKESGEEK